MSNLNYSDEIIADVLDNLKEWLYQKCAQYSFDFEWVGISPQINMSGACFQHICFRIGNCVYSCRIYLYESSIVDSQELAELIPTPLLCAEEESISICNNNNLIPCDLILDVKHIKEPLFIHKGLNLDIFSMAKDNDMPTEVSEYELNATALKILMKTIEDNGMMIQSFTDMPNLKPSIYCLYNNRKYAIILQPYVGDKVPKKFDFPFRQLRSEGFHILVAPIGLAQMNNIPNLIRGAKTLTNYNGELWEVHSFLGIKTYSRFNIQR